MLNVWISASTHVHSPYTCLCRTRVHQSVISQFPYFFCWKPMLHLFFVRFLPLQFEVHVLVHAFIIYWVSYIVGASEYWGTCMHVHFSLFIHYIIIITLPVLSSGIILWLKFCYKEWAAHSLKLYRGTGVAVKLTCVGLSPPASLNNIIVTGNGR